MSESIATVARDQLRALAALLKTGWVSKDAQVLVRQFGALAELAREHQLSELSTLARALSASVLLYVKQGPDAQGRARFMDLGRKVNALLLKDGGLKTKAEKDALQAAPLVEIRDDFRPVFMLVELDPNQSAVAARELQGALALRQFNLRVFAEGDALTDALSKTTPAALICEAALMPAMSELLDFIEKEQPGLSMRVPLIAVNRQVSAARRLTAALGWADSYLEAPTATQIAEATAELATPKSDAPYQVLIVDDDRQQAMFCAGVLKRKGMEVISALSAEEALVALTSMRPDLVLMDLYLPGLNGMELTAILRQRSDSLLLPIVFLSGEQDAQKRFDALNIGGDDYLTKPIRPRHLATAVASRIKRVRALRAQLNEARLPVDTHGLYRRPAFLELLQQQAERGQTASVQNSGQALLYVMLDHAESLLFDLGMLGENVVEQELCTRLSEASDSADALTSLGNFEYALLANRADGDRLHQLSEALRTAISGRAVAIKHDELALSVSIGVIEQADAKKSAERWLTLGQMAAQRAQHRGGNQVERGMHGAPRAAPARLKVIENLLSETPSRNNTVIEYQPIVPLRGPVLAQYAQLLRLRGNTISTAMLTRADYAELGERLGAIAKFDRFACLQGLEAIRDSDRYGAATRLFVRCSTASLLGDLASSLKSELSMAAITPERLVLEFDLHELELELAASTKRLQQLRALGLSICINIALKRPRLGAMLQKLQPNTLKLHANLITNAQDSVEFLASLSAVRESCALIAIKAASAEALPVLWAQQIDYVQADFLGPAGSQMNFSFAPLKIAG
jgi:PleD family two-component response regulator/EAL domain-containing protein (putative c-di-GMP-specific phosphodiesterase class I)